MILGQAILVNSLIGGVILLSLFQFTHKRLRFYFVLMCLAGAAYINPVILTNAGLEQGTLEIVSRLVFFFGALTVAAIACFLMAFAKPALLRSAWFWAVQGLIVIAGLFSLASDLIVAGLDMSGPKPVFGPLQAPYQLLLAADFLLALGIFAGVAIRSENSLLRYQMTVVGLTFTVAIILMMATNLVAPLLTGDHRTAKLGPIWLLIPIIGIFRVVVHAKKRELFRKSRNFIDQHIEIASSVERILARESHTAVIHFTDDVKIALRNYHSEPQEHMAEKISPRMVQGLVADKNRLAYENLQMAVQIETIRQGNRELDKQERLLPAQTKRLPQSSAQQGAAAGLFFDEHIPYLREIAQKNLALYGQEMLGVSSEFSAMLAQAESYARSRQLVLVHGEAGSGKAVLARAVHFLRTGKKLPEVSCYSSGKQELRDIFTKYLADSDADKGLLVRHIDYLDAEDLMVFHPLLSQENNGYVYLTAKKDFLNVVAAPEELLPYFNQLLLPTLPLKDSADDLTAQLLWFAAKYAASSGMPYQQISEKFLQSAVKYSWPGNSRELITTVQKAILQNRPPVLEKMQLDSLLPDIGDSKFGPLEASERQVIAGYLRKNRYNKNRTRLQLGITINTLNAKINKYKIALPKESN